MKRATPQPKPWWTDADQAELDMLLWEFLGAAWRHKLDCSSCVSENRFCGPLSTAWDAIEEWLASRRLKSKAEWLRARQTIDNRAAAA